MSNSEHTFDDELISAFLDGQLSDIERARVERALLEDPRCRRTWNDLRAIRESLQSLPANVLGSDFQDKVLRQVDAVIREKRDGSTDAAERENAVSTEPNTTVSKLKRNWRVATWAIGTIAAAAVLLIVLVIPDQQQVANLARNDAQVEESSEHESDGVSRAEPTSQPRPSLRTEKGSLERKTERFSEDSPVPKDETLGVVDTETLHLDAEDADVALSDHPRDEAAVTTPRPTGRARQGMFSRAKEGAAKQMGTPQGQPQPAGNLADLAADDISPIAADRPSAELIAEAMQQSGAQYLVNVTVNRSETGNQAFTRSLANNQIQFKKQAELNALTPRSLGRSVAVRSSGMAGDEPEQLAYQFDPNHSAGQADHAKTPQLVVVEATETRLRNTVNELLRNRDEFQVVEVFEVASQSDSNLDLRSGGRLRRFDLARPFRLEPSGLGIAADQSEPAKDSLQAEPALEKRVSGSIQQIQGSVHVLFVLSPSSPTPGLTAAEPAAGQIGPSEPVAEPNENR